MNNWDIQPFVGAGALKFGMARADTQHLLSGNEWIKRSIFNSNHTKDAYVSLGIDLQFDADILVVIEAYALSSAPWVFKGISIFEHSIESFSVAMLDVGMVATHRYDEGCCFENIGLTVFQPRDRETLAALALHSKEEFDHYLRVVGEIEEKQRERARRRSDPHYKPPRNPFLQS